MPTNVQLDANANGSVSFATEVVATIAGLAATEIEGVASMAGANNGTSLADILSRRMANNSKNLTKGVKVEVQDGKVIVDVNFIVEYGSPVPEVAKNIQENVKKAIETMSGLTVETVDVHVQGISFERENKAVAEIEQQQRLLLQKQQEDEREQREKNDPVDQLRKEEQAEPVQAEEAAQEAAEETAEDEISAGEEEGEQE
ncbi:MAG: Asp23/Gls24 family envelope stress response protein [Clostridia bacterium]|nr:Asp23/Gls24 family envelope stress response protein [Clostridia bacterium]